MCVYFNEEVFDSNSNNIFFFYFNSYAQNYSWALDTLINYGKLKCVPSCHNG